MPEIKPRTASIVVYQGDDMEHLAELRADVQHAERYAGPARAGDGDSVQEAKNAFDAFVDEAAERAVKIEIRAIGRRAFRDLLAEHPPRKVPGPEGEETHPDDEMFDVNTSTFTDALLTYRSDEVRTITAPDFPTVKACQKFLDEDLSDGDYDQLFTAAYFLNRQPGADPKAVRFSADSRS